MTQVLRDGTRISTRQKAAAIGGKPDQQFEQSFASLAYQHIADKAPALLDYMVGFQLVDRNDDATKAAGVFGFKMGNDWLYAPVFFINGNLKGHELLYLKSQDMFVPLKENWINFILGRQPRQLGEGVPQTADQLGVLQPDLQSLTQAPGSAKYSHVMRPQLKPWFTNSGGPRLLGRMLTTSPNVKHAGLTERLRLPELLKQHPDYIKLALAMRQAYPHVKLAMDRFYGPNLLRDCLLEMQERFARQTDPFLAKRADLLPGGKGDGKKPGSAKQREEGCEHEMEHTADPDIACEIASDHLTEDPQYYSKLEKIEKDSAADPVKKVEILTEETITQNTPEELTEAEQEKLLQQGYLIRDARKGEEVSVAYNTQQVMELTNPDETVVAEVLVAQGKFEKCLVIHHPHAGDGRRNFATLVRLSDDRKRGYRNAHRSCIFLRPNTDVPVSSVSEFTDWFKTLPEKETLEAGSKYVVLSPSGEGTCVFTVDENLGEGTYEVHWDAYCDWDYRAGTDYDSTIGGCNTCHCDTVNFGTRQGTSFKSVNGTLYFPRGARALRVAAADRCRKCDRICRECTCDYCFPEPSDPSPRLQPGDLASVQLQLLQKSAATSLALTATTSSRTPGLPVSDVSGVLWQSRRGKAGAASSSQELTRLRPLKVWTDQNEVVINSRRMPKLAGLFHLVRDFGLAEKQAKRIIQTAERGSAGRYWVKLAAPYQGELGPYATMEGGYGAPTDVPPALTQNTAYGNVPVQQYMGDKYVPIPALSASQTDPSIYDPMQNIDPQAVRTVQQAQQTGQREVFDTAMFSTMLRATRQESMVNRYLGDLMKSLDRWGRILLHFFYHNEEFADRYGKKDLPELEDTLRNVFESSGDGILFLKQKTVEPLMFGAPSLDEAANR